MEVEVADEGVLRGGDGNARSGNLKGADDTADTAVGEGGATGDTAVVEDGGVAFVVHRKEVLITTAGGNIAAPTQVGVMKNSQPLGRVGMCEGRRA